MPKDNTNDSFITSLNKTLYEQTNERYLEESKIVLFNVIIKKENESSFIADRTAIGYMLPNNTVYDFTSKKTYDMYKLYDKANKEKEGIFALVCYSIFTNSNKKIRLTEKKLLEIEMILKNHIDKYVSQKLKNYSNQLENDEHIPIKSKTRY